MNVLLLLAWLYTNPLMCADTKLLGVIKSGKAWHAPDFLKLLLSGKSVCVHVRVRVSAPHAVKNHSHEIKPEYPIKQVLLLFSFFVWHLLLILLMGRPLVMNRVVSYYQRRAR